MFPGDEVLRLLASLAVLLGLARLLGELAQRLGQPAVLGEILAGVLLGPSALGRLAPDSAAWLFPDQGPAAHAVEGLSILALILFLLVAGMEVDLSAALRRRRLTLIAGSAGMALPFVLGWVVALSVPDLVGGRDGREPELFAPFFAAALSISALPVIARILMDLHLHRSDFGSSVVAAAMLNDLVGWMIFAVLVWLASGTGPHPLLGAGATLGFTLVALTVVRRAIDRALPWLLANTSFPAGFIGAAVVLALAGAAFTQLAGVHAIFGAFLVGAAIGDSRHLREHARATLSGFVQSVFAPIFFATIGLRVDFVAHFDGVMCLVVLALACCGKLVGCGLGAYAAGLRRREALAFGFAMNARGSMEIVFGLLALEGGLIGERTFVALVVMALVTTWTSGPALRWLLRLRRRGGVEVRAFVPRLSARSPRAAVQELVEALPARSGLDRARAVELVWERERLMPTGLGAGVAVPHARVDGLAAPEVALGLSPAGLDFDAPDAAPCHLVALLLTPRGEDATHLELLSELAELLLDARLRARLHEAGTLTEVRAVLRTELPERGRPER